MQRPEAGTVLSHVRRIRASIGDDAFTAVLRDRLHPEDVDFILEATTDD
jgi:hypothetical protein